MEPLSLLQATLENNNVQTPAEAGQGLVKSEHFLGLSQGQVAQLLWHIGLFLHRGKTFPITCGLYQLSSQASQLALPFLCRQ